MGQRRIQQFQVDPNLGGGTTLTPGSGGDGIEISGSPLSIINVDNTVIRTTGTQTITGTKTFNALTNFNAAMSFNPDNGGVNGLQTTAVGSELRLIPKNGTGTAYDTDGALRYDYEDQGEWTAPIFKVQDVEGLGGYFTAGVDGTAAEPQYQFSATGIGMYYNEEDNENQLNFSTASQRRLSIESNGTLSVAGTANYENLVTSDDDIPNKRYVDDAVAGAGGTADLPSFSGTSNITGLDSSKRYLVSVYGVMPVGSTGGAATIGAVRVGTGTTAGGGTQLASTGVVAGNWPDGSAPQSATFALAPGVTSINGAVNFGGLDGFNAATSMTAVEIGESVLTGEIGLSNRNFFDAGPLFGPAGMQIQFLNGGALQSVGQNVGAATYAGEWTVFAPTVTAISPNYEIQVSTISISAGATLSGPPLNTWLNMGTSRIWNYFNNSLSGIRTWQFNVQIRDVATSTIQDSAVYTVTIEGT